MAVTDYLIIWVTQDVLNVIGVAIERSHERNRKERIMAKWELVDFYPLKEQADKTAKSLKVKGYKVKVTKKLGEQTRLYRQPTEYRVWAIGWRNRKPTG